MSEVRGKQKRRIRKGGKWVEVECDVVVINGVVKYVIDSEWYFVRVWYAKGFSKPGFSGTNIYPLINT